MADIGEVEQYEEGIYQLETTDPVEGGATGVDNLPHKHLANRTKWLKAQIDKIFAGTLVVYNSSRLEDKTLEEVKTYIIDALVDGAGDAYNTLIELQNEIQNNDGDITGILTTLSHKADEFGDDSKEFRASQLYSGGEKVVTLPVFHEYSWDDMPDDFLSNVDIAGDDTVSVGYAKIHLNQIGNFVDFSLRFNIEDISVDFPTESAISFNFDLLRMMNSADPSIAAISNYVYASGHHEPASDTLDFSREPIYCSISTNGTAYTSNNDNQSRNYDGTVTNPDEATRLKMYIYGSVIITRT